MKKYKSASILPLTLCVQDSNAGGRKKTFEVVKSISSLVFRSHKSPSVNNDVMKY